MECTKKCITVYDLKQKELPVRQIRKGKKKKMTKDINVQKEEKDLKEIREVCRMDECKEDKNRPVKSKLRIQAAVEQILRNARKLASNDECKRTYIERDRYECGPEN